MRQKARHLLALPAFENSESAWRAKILATVTLALPAMTIGSGLLMLLLTPVPAVWILTRLLPTSLLWVGCWLLLRQGRLRQASVAFVSLTWIVSCVLIFASGGLNAPLVSVTLTLVFIGGALLGRRAILLLSVVTALATGGAALLGRFGVLPDAGPMMNPIVLMLATWTSLTVAAAVAYMLVQGNEESLAFARRANETLREEQERQSARIASQARVLRTSAEISRRLSTILDQGELVSAVVNQIQSAFNFYHVHVYLYDASRQSLVIVGGTGEAGRALLMGGHKVPAAKGLIGLCAEENRPVLATDVRSNDIWLPNPLLPDTRSEAAVPILRGDVVVGVLDVQQDVVNGLHESDVEMLQLIASQLAIALQNAESFERARQRVRQESLVNLIGQQIQRAGTVDEVLAVAAEELGRALGAGRALAELGVAAPSNGAKPGGRE